MVIERMRPEEVHVARAEDDRVEDLRDEGDAWPRTGSVSMLVLVRPEERRRGERTFSARIRVDGPYQNALRDGVRDIGQDAEDVDFVGHDGSDGGTSDSVGHDGSQEDENEEFIEALDVAEG